MSFGEKKVFTLPKNATSLEASIIDEQNRLLVSLPLAENLLQLVSILIIWLFALSETTSLKFSIIRNLIGQLSVDVPILLKYRGIIEIYKQTFNDSSWGRQLILFPENWSVYQGENWSVCQGKHVILNFMSPGGSEWEHALLQKNSWIDFSPAATYALNCLLWVGVKVKDDHRS